MPSSNSSPILAALREATKEIHQKLEETSLAQDLISPTLRQDKYEHVLTLFGTWFVAAERALREHQDWIAAELDEGRFQREEWLAQDLPNKNLNFPELPSIPQSEVLGWLYVLEGSTLGGKQISRNLHQRREASGGHWPTQFFDGYGTETGPRWQNFLQFLAKKIPEGHRDFESTLKGAIDAFQSFQHWQDAHSEDTRPASE